VYRHDHAQRRVDIFELLAHDPKTDVVHARAAVLRRHAHAKEAELRHLGQQPAIEPVLAIQLLNRRRDFPRRPLTRGLLEQQMVFTEIEIQFAQMLTRDLSMSQRRGAKTQSTKTSLP
jgi:hypothetical protein